MLEPRAFSFVEVTPMCHRVRGRNEIETMRHAESGRSDAIDVIPNPASGYRVSQGKLLVYIIYLVVDEGGE